MKRFGLGGSMGIAFAAGSMCTIIVSVTGFPAVPLAILGTFDAGAAIYAWNRFLRRQAA
jgi:hypothetical protein